MRFELDAAGDELATGRTCTVSVDMCGGVSSGAREGCCILDFGDVLVLGVKKLLSSLCVFDI